MGFSLLYAAGGALERWHLHRETKALQLLGQKIRQQQLSEDELAAFEVQCAVRSLDVQNTDLRVIRAFTRHVVCIERLRRQLVPHWTRAEMLGMVEPGQLVTRSRVDACLQWLWAGERAFRRHARCVDIQFSTYVGQLRAMALSAAGIASMVEKLQSTQSQHRRLNKLIVQELQLIQQLHATARPLAADGRLRINGQGELLSDDPDFKRTYEATRARLASLEAQSTAPLQEMDILPSESDSAPPVSQN